MLNHKYIKFPLGNELSLSRNVVYVSYFPLLIHRWGFPKSQCVTWTPAQRQRARRPTDRLDGGGDGAAAGREGRAGVWTDAPRTAVVIICRLGIETRAAEGKELEGCDEAGTREDIDSAASSYE